MPPSLLGRAAKRKRPRLLLSRLSRSTRSFARLRQTPRCAILSVPHLFPLLAEIAEILFCKHTFGRNLVEPSAVLPAILLSFTPCGQVTADEITAHILQFTAEGDVFCPGFAAAVVVQQHGPIAQPASLESCESIAMGANHVPLIRVGVTTGAALPAGPTSCRGSRSGRRGGCSRTKPMPSSHRSNRRRPPTGT